MRVTGRGESGGRGEQVELRPAADRFHTEGDGLTSRHSFSFGAHYDPANVGFGALLVSNEERVGPGRGFDLHPHANAEIVTWVLSGALLHTDSRGEQGLVYPGLAQRMSAGRGIDHAERNDAYRTDGGYRIDPERVIEPVHFVQMWLRPDEPDATPSYQQDEVGPVDLAAGWVPVASGSHPDAAVTIGSRASTLWITVLIAGESRTVPDAALAHVFVARGKVRAENVGPLGPGDALRLRRSTALRLTAVSAAEVLVWELAP